MKNLYFLTACLLLWAGTSARATEPSIPGPRLLQKLRAAAAGPQSSAAQSQATSRQSPGPQGGNPLTSVAAGWEGIPSDFTLEPPDPSGAAGPNGILATVNLRIAYYDKIGNPIWGPIDHATFFSSVGINGNNLLSDPHTLYDAVAGRFYTILQEADLGASKSYLNLAVSKTSNPLTATTADWFFYRIDDTESSGGITAFTDYPGMGFDGQAIYVTYNMFTFPINSSRFTNAVIITIDKNAAMNGNTNYNFTYVNGFTLQPCTVLSSSNTPPNVAYFAETLFFVDQRHVRISALSDPLGVPTLSSTLVSVPDNGGFPPFSGAPQAGTGIPIDTLDGRTEGNAFYYNGNIWFCHTAGGAFGKSFVYYYNVAVNGYPGGTPSLVEEGSIDGGAGEWTYQPNIGCNALGDVGLVYCQSSASRYPTIMATTRKAGATGFDAPVEIKASPSFYFGGRWGDFASVTADSVDNSFWMTHEWARSTRPGDWGTWWARLEPTLAPNLVVATNYLIAGNGNGMIDPNECSDLLVVLTNIGSFGATNITARLSTTTPGVILAQRASPYPDLPIGAGGTNIVAFKISTSPTFLCGTPVLISMFVKCDQITTTNILQFNTGIVSPPLRFDSAGPVPIPDFNSAGTNSFIVVSNLTGALGKVTVSVYITHTFDS